jgi:hypothetical protein
MDSMDSMDDLPDVLGASMDVRILASIEEILVSLSSKFCRGSRIQDPGSWILDEAAHFSWVFHMKLEHACNYEP